MFLGGGGTNTENPATKNIYIKAQSRYWTLRAPKQQATEPNPTHPHLPSFPYSHPLFYSKQQQFVKKNMKIRIVNTNEQEQSYIVP